MLASAPSINLPPSDQWSWGSWVLGLASAAVLFFLAWGLKDVKARYDKVPLLEAKNTELEGKIRRLCAELGKHYEDC